MKKRLLSSHLIKLRVRMAVADERDLAASMESLVTDGRAPSEPAQAALRLWGRIVTYAPDRRFR